MSKESHSQKQSPKQDASTALYYLSQEVSKLSSPVRSSFVGSGWFDSEENKLQSLRCSSTSFTTQVKKLQSPLKLLNLIDQQCEKLLMQNEVEEQGCGSLLILDFGNSNVSLVPLLEEQLPDSVQLLNPERHCIKKSDDQLIKECSSEDTAVCPIKTTISENTDPVPPEKREGAVGAPQASGLKFSVALDLSRDWTDECISTQCTFYDFLPEPHRSNEPSSDAHLIFRSSDKEQFFALDQNANICLNPAETPNELLESVTSKFCESSSSVQQNPSGVQGNTASTCEDSAEEIPKCNEDNTLSISGLEKDDRVQCSTWRSKSRKQPRPSRSASVQDPDFQGVTFRMDTELDDSKDQCRLLITSKYSTDLPKNAKRTRLRTRTSQKCLKTSSDEDSDSTTSDAKNKVCASCSTSKTPMWRDAEDGTPLCNACGIRYKKYRVRCTNCWHIPKKDGNSVSRCSRCGHFVRPTSAQRKSNI